MTLQGILPLTVQQAAATERLGAFRKAYQANLVRTIVVVIIFLVAATCFFVGFTFEHVSNGTTGAVLLLFALFFLGVALYMAYDAIQAAHQQVYLFQQGIVIEKRNQVQVFSWRDTEVWQSITRRYSNGVYVGTTYMYTLRRVDGSQIKLGNLTKDIAELGQAITAGITHDLAPRALYAVRTGKTLTFAHFSLNQQGISNGREFLSWPQVQAVEVSRGHVIVKKTGTSSVSWMTLVAKIPNVLVFTVVIEEMRRQAGSGSTHTQKN